MTLSVLFVCLGNICRSPLAEAALRRDAERLGLDVHVDSAGTAGWHTGKRPDTRAIAVARKNGVDISGLRARQVSPADFARFDHILALDLDNLRALEALRPSGAGAQLSLLLDHVPGRGGQAVADPYHGEAADFDAAWADAVAGAKALVRKLATPT